MRRMSNDVKISRQPNSGVTAKRLGLNGLYMKLTQPLGTLLLRLPRAGMFALGAIGGIAFELIRLKVEVKGQTYYDFTERRASEKQWKTLTYDEKMTMLTKNDRLDLVYAVDPEEAVIKPYEPGDIKKQILSGDVKEKELVEKIYGNKE